MALSVGNTTSAEVGSAASSLTFSHNNDGNVVAVSVASLTGGAGPTGVTYGGVAMTEGASGTDGTSKVSLIYTLANAAAGANDVVVTYGGLRNFGASATSFIDADTASPTGASSGATALTNNDAPTRTFSTLNDGSIVIDCVLLLAARTATVGADQTQRTNLQIVGDGYILSSTEPKATAGSVTMSWSLSAAVNWTNCALEIKAVAAPAATGRHMLLMGVGT